MRGILLSFVAALVLAGGLARAEGTDTPAIDQRVLNQERRIQEGVNSGQLTEQEANRMTNRWSVPNTQRRTSKPMDRSPRKSAVA